MEKIYNFRDFGGYNTQTGKKIKRGILYRSAQINSPSLSDLKRIEDLGIKTIVDFRSPGEIKRKPDIVNKKIINYIHIPIQIKKNNDQKFLFHFLSMLFKRKLSENYFSNCKRIYIELTGDFHQEYKKAIKLIMNPDNLPVLFHCAAGKDRTGLAIAFIQMLLGVSKENIFDEYLLTNKHIDNFIMLTEDKIKPLRFFGISINDFMPLIEARSEYLESSINYIETHYKSFKDFIIHKLGFSESEIEQFHALILEEN